MIYKFIIPPQADMIAFFDLLKSAFYINNQKVDLSKDNLWDLFILAKRAAESGYSQTNLYDNQIRSYSLIFGDKQDSQEQIVLLKSLIEKLHVDPDDLMLLLQIGGVWCLLEQSNATESNNRIIKLWRLFFKYLSYGCILFTIYSFINNLSKI